MSHKILLQLCQAFSLGSNVLVGGHLFLDHEPIVAPNFSLLFFLQTLNFLSAFLITSHNTISHSCYTKIQYISKTGSPLQYQVVEVGRYNPEIRTLQNIQIEHSRAGFGTFCINPSEITVCSLVHTAGVSSLKIP